MLYATGMRLDELCHLRCADIIHSSMKIYIRHSKNHSDRYVPLTESIWQMILDYWYTFPAPERPREWLFTQQTRLDHPMDKQWIQREVLLLRRSLKPPSEIRQCILCRALHSMHCIISGGGLTKAKQLQISKGNFFIPVEVLRDKFKGKYLHFLDNYYQNKELTFSSSCKELRNSYQ